ncbi:hypothetical protein C7T94_14780 [Pedobacter yulinensis]|uniref:DUF4983 domain-containing protein n=1 Tax=Pedobacter yulinensis TaxID=2126353 RepID=A0A2T3HI16_9SPHI|nr:DUF4983 domain-containing protein [Pedobacter yulinensis]PST82070.1 hypothetical protein C7T94_14780 [Pedobacter yulinensis]
MKKFHSYHLLVFLGLTVLGTIFSCNKGFDRMIEERENLDTATARFGNRKVLYLIVDGARGQSVLEANTPNIDAVLPQSIYSWVSLSDPDSTRNVSNWANMLTGVKKEKHKILNENLTGADLQNYPAVLKRIKETRAQTRIVSHSSSAVFNKLVADADQKDVQPTDAAVKNAVISSLSTDTAAVIIGNFTSVYNAGQQSGFDNSFAPYKAAIETFDGYVGEILTALKKRSTFADEQWLVVIASSGGGKYQLPANQDDQTVFSNTAANTFVIYHSPGYKQRIVAKPFTGNRYLGKTVRLKGKDVRAQIDSAEAYNLTDTSTFTIELKVKKNQEIFNWPSILGKRGEWSSGHPTTGWVIYLEDKYWYFEWRGSKNTGDYRQCRGGDLKANRWEHISVKCEKRGTQYFIRTYTNGSFNTELEITNSGTLANNNPLKLGYLNGNGHGEPDVYVSDIRFFRTSVPEATISRYSCETSIDQSHPYWSFIAGYWPATDGNGSKMVDLSPQARDFNLLGNPAWENFNDLMCPPSTETLALLVPQTADIPAQIINWLKIPSKQSWQLDGRVWLDQ